MVDRVPAAEWAQIFDEVWRRFRDFFYVENNARLRLEGAARPVSPAAGARRPPLRPQLRHRRDGGGAERQPRLHRGRRLGDSRPAAGRPAGRRLRARRRGPGATASPRSSRATTRSRATGRRSPRSASMRNVGDYVLAIDGEELLWLRQSLPRAACTAPTGRCASP